MTKMDEMIEKLEKEKITSKYTYICCRYGDVDVGNKTTVDEENVQEGFLY